MAIRMYCTNERIAWKPALRRIMAIVFGIDVLATSCAVGRTNSKFVSNFNTLMNCIPIIYTKWSLNGLVLCE